MRVRGDRTPAENGEALRAALASITDASATKPYVIQLAPGIYELGHDDAGDEARRVDRRRRAAATRITGDQGQATLGEALVLGADRTLLRDVTVVNRGDVAAHFHTVMAVLGGATMRIEDAVVEGGGSRRARSTARQRARPRRTVIAVFVTGGSDVRIRGSELAASSQGRRSRLRLRERLDGGGGEQRAREPGPSPLTAVAAAPRRSARRASWAAHAGPVTCVASYDGSFAPVDAGCN